MMGNSDLLLVFHFGKIIKLYFYKILLPLPLVSFLKTRGKLPWANTVNSDYLVNIWGKNQYAKEARKIGSFDRSPSIDKLVFQEPVLCFWMYWYEMNHWAYKRCILKCSKICITGPYVKKKKQPARTF